MGWEIISKLECKVFLLFQYLQYHFNTYLLSYKLYKSFDCNNLFSNASIF